MSVINTNYLSLVAQNNLGKSQSALGTAIERLSSGLRINSAKDDAAGQAIANRMTAQVNGLNQAQRNANDGISVAQTAEGALNQVNDNLQRVRELTVQSANGTNSAEDLQSIQDEINQRLAEIDRISEQTDFNGVKVLAEDKALQIQVGANDAEVITVGLQQVDSGELGLTNFTVGGLSGPISSITVANTTGGGDATTEVDLTAVATSIGGGVTVDELSLYSYDDSGTTKYAVKGPDGTMYSVNVDVDDAAATFGDVTINGADADAAAANYTTDADAGLTATSNPLELIDEALKTVDSLRSELGAVQNRFESAITNLQTNSTNLQAARSRIEDADYAVEVANMSKNQILQQAGTSVLAQANQIPQGVLSLLR